MIKKRNQSGFTIVELLLAMVFFSFILTFATASYIQVNRSYVRGANIKLVQENARRILNEISTDVRLAGNSSVFTVDYDSFDSYTANPIEVICDPETYSGASSVGDNCRKRICIGSTVYAWNEAFVDDRDEQYVDTGEVFKFVKTTSPNAISSKEQCRDVQINFADSVELIDGSRLMVQDIDFKINGLLTGVYRVDIVISTLNGPTITDSDLNYQRNPEDNFLPISPLAEGDELKAGTYNDSWFGNGNIADGCKPEQKSLEFCHVEGFTSLITTR